MITVDHCDWDHPGAARFSGDVPAAVAHYKEIPAPVRTQLRARIERHEFDDIAEIRRDSIVGRHAYADLREMHSASSICHNVSRAKWSDAAVERGLVYCVDDHCVIVPTDCGNISLVTRLRDRGAPVVAIDLPTELGFDPPGAITLAPVDVPALVDAPPLDNAPALVDGQRIPLTATPDSETFEGSSVMPGLWLPVIGGGAVYYVTSAPPTTPAIPEPSTSLLLIAGITGLALLQARKR
jgi:hypothetical protein